MKDIRQADEWAKYLSSIGWKAEKVGSTLIYLKRISLLGWFVKIQRPTNLSEKVINFIELKYHPFQFSIEPSNKSQVELIKKLNFKLSNSPSLPTKSLIIDLTKSEKRLLESFSQKTRYNIKLSKNKDLKIVKSNNISIFTKFWRENFEKKRFPFFSQQKNIVALSKAFNKNSHILLAQKGNETVAALFILTFDKVAYYMYAASNNTGRKLFTPTLLTWEAVLLAKKSRCKVFDFDGIYDERFPIKSWLGFTKFKKGFGGKETEYPGNFTRTRSIIKI